MLSTQPQSLEFSSITKNDSIMIHAIYPYGGFLQRGYPQSFKASITKNDSIMIHAIYHIISIWRFPTKGVPPIIQGIMRDD